MSQAFISLQNLSKSFGSFQALKDVSLDIHKGEFLSILGPSGCGKTTLLRILAGLEHSDSGRIVMEGKDIGSLPPAARGFGIVFQSYALFPNMSALANVAYGLHKQKSSKSEKEARAMDMLKLVGLDQMAHKLPAQLSGGQQQRVALARALAPGPSLLLLDEPLSALDAKVRQSLREEMRHLQHRLGITTVMVTHDQEESLGLSDRIVVMDHGVVEQVDSPMALYDQPSTRFVADFVGAMNFLKAKAGADGHFELGGAQLSAGRAQQTFSSGQVVSLAIRPQEIRLVGGPGPQVLRAEVADMEYQGGAWRVKSRLEDGGSISLDLEAPGDQKAPFTEGSPVFLELPSDRIRVFPAQDA